MTERLPIPGGDLGTWSETLNGFLRVAHNEDGTLKAGDGATSVVQGAAADGVTDDTTIVQAAITALPAGGTLAFPPGNYSVSDLAVTNKTDVVLDGRGATLTWRAGGVDTGLRLSGTCSNVEIRGFRMVGNGVVGNKHYGVYCSSGQTLTNIRVVRNHIYNVVTGIALGSTSGGGTLHGLLVEGNYLDTIVGTASGQGYGIQHASDQADSAHVRIVGNTIVGAQRHAIYQAMGHGVTIAHNTIRNHRQGVATGSLVSALVVARSSDVVVSDNILIDVWDGGIEVDPDTSQPVRNVVVANNLIVNPHAPSAIDVGFTGADDIEHIDVLGNSVRVASGVTMTVVRVYTGKHVKVSTNSVSFENATGTSIAFEVACSGETAGTANDTDNVTLEHNSVSGAGGSNIVPINLPSAAAGASSVLKFVNNRRSGSGDMFTAGASITNPNITIAHQPDSGLTLSGATSWAAMDTPSPASRLVAGHVRNYWAETGATEMWTPSFVESDRDMIARLASGAQTRIGLVGPGSESGILLGASGAQADLYKFATGVVGTTGDIAIAVAGKGLRIKEGANAKMGVATLVGGTATVATTAVAATSRVFLTSQADGGTPGWVRVSTRTAGTSFTITSSSGTDTSTVAWEIKDPA